ncbi:MAG: hypothetical protein MUO21_01715 [Nitrososphaeraceae archaeon]|nr:hypothetical protein [Nitrososphaeraceae archaeon]
MDDIIGNIARLGLSSSMAKEGMAIVSRFFLQNAEPNKASGLLSMLPSSITDIFSNDEKKEFTTSQQKISEDEVIEKISNECCNRDKQKGKRVYEEAVKMIKENSGQEGEGFLDGIIGNFKKGVF